MSVNCGGPRLHILAQISCVVTVHLTNINDINDNPEIFDLEFTMEITVTLLLNLNLNGTV